MHGVQLELIKKLGLPQSKLVVVKAYRENELIVPNYEIVL